MKVEPPEDFIRPDLLDMIEGAKALLAHQGAVQVRIDRDGQRNHRLRFRQKDSLSGRPRYRTVPLGPNPLVACAVDKMLMRYRSECWTAEMAESRRRLQQAAAAQDLANLRAGCQAFAHSRRQRQDIGRSFDRLSDDPRELFVFCLLAPHSFEPRRPGRPHKRTLW
jgi:hypothetical protein